jgi:hypothetical protein
VNFGASTPGPGNWLNHLAIDPFNSAHAMYGDGQTIWQTTNITAADGVATNSSTITLANPTNWSIGAVGIEETVINGLVSPPAETTGGTPPNELISVMDDLGGFSFPEAVIESAQSPANGADKNPAFTSGTSVDYAGQAGLILARVGTSSGSQLGGYSTDGGQTWTPFASLPTGVTVGGGSIAVSADGSRFVWSASDSGTGAFYSTDNGTTWTSCAGAPTQSTNNAQILVYADRVNAQDFYILNPANSSIVLSTDGGQTFTGTPGMVPTGTTSLAVSPAAAGDVWLIGSSGLYESLDGAMTFPQIDPVTSPNEVGEVSQTLALGFGQPDSAEQATYPTLYLSGYLEQTTINAQTQQPQVSLVNGIYRSIDQGQTWVLLTTTDQDWGGVYSVAGDLNIFGRVYLGTHGRGILYGDSTN